MNIAETQARMESAKRIDKRIAGGSHQVGRRGSSPGHIELQRAFNVSIVGERRYDFGCTHLSLGASWVV